MSNLLDDHQKLSLPFGMALKVLRSYMTLRAKLQMTLVFTLLD